MENTNNFSISLVRALVIMGLITFASYKIPQANTYLFITTLFTAIVAGLLLLMQFNKGGDRVLLRFHKEAFPTLFFAAAITIFLNLAAWQILRNHLLPFKLFAVFSFVVLGFIIYFFRKPAPTNFAELDSQSIIAPAFGKVVQIIEAQETEHFNTAMRQISIFMSPLNIHVNWAPIAGKIDYFKYFPGKYLVAFHPKSSELNEHSSTAIVNDNFGVLVKQIAGFMARKIVCYVPDKTAMEQLDEIGFIRFGSRVDVFLPLTADVQVSVGERVVGGQTILAKMP